MHGFIHALLMIAIIIVLFRVFTHRHIRIHRRRLIIDEFTRESLAIDVGRRITAADVIDVLRYLFLVRGEPVYIRSDNGPEFTAIKVKKWLKDMGYKDIVY